MSVLSLFYLSSETAADGQWIDRDRHPARSAGFTAV